MGASLSQAGWHVRHTTAAQGERTTKLALKKGGRRGGRAPDDERERLAGSRGVCGPCPEGARTESLGLRCSARRDAQRKWESLLVMTAGCDPLRDVPASSEGGREAATRRWFAFLDALDRARQLGATAAVVKALSPSRDAVGRSRSSARGRLGPRGHRPPIRQAHPPRSSDGRRRDMHLLHG